MLNAVGTEFIASESGQVEQIAAFLQQSFHAASDAPFLNRALLKWKYYEAGPSWPGSRSYMLRDEQLILAHAAIWPIQLHIDGRERSGIGFSDWAASEEHRGIGLLLVKKLITLASFTLVTGGAEITRQILPRMGFQPWASLPVYAKVLRPFRQLWTRPSYAGWKEPARLGRNIAWSMKPSAPVGNWTAAQDIANEEALSTVQGQNGSVHNVEFLGFMTRCPTVPIGFYNLREGGVLKGYAMVSSLDGQARIADLRIDSEVIGDWQRAVSAITKAIEQNTRICEVVAVSSTPLLESALQANGFQLRERRPLVVYDSERQLADTPVPQLGMLEDDSSFLRVPEYPYLT